MFKILAKFCTATMLAMLLFILSAMTLAETSGTLGENISWILDDAGTLTITGTGDMPNDENMPLWGTDVKSVVISPGITSIADNAFYECMDLASITIPGSVTAIGRSSFYRCTALKSIELPDGLTNIADNAFCLCSSLTQIDLPDALTDIGSSAFCQTGLTEIVLPDGLTTISDGLFIGCTSLKSVTIPDSVVTICSSAFQGCSPLASISIPASVTYIGDFAFRYTSIGDVYFYGYELPYIGVSIFRGSPIVHCYENSEIDAWAQENGYEIIYMDNSGQDPWIPPVDPEISGTCGPDITWVLDSDKNLTITGTGEMPNDENMPLWGTDVKNAVISSGITSIADNAFYECMSLKSISIPDSVTSIGNWAFYRCTGLKSIDLPEKLTRIGDSAFNSCSSLTQIDLPDTLMDIGSSAFDQTGLTEIVLPKGLTTISDSLLSSCFELKSVVIPDSVVTIGSSAFIGCSELTSISIPDSVTSIGMYAFRYTSIYDICFYGYDMPELGNHVFDISPTVHCYEYSDVDYWATESGYETVYIADTNPGPWNPPEDVSANGSCGEAITWVLDSNKNLTITGTGDMPNDENMPLWGTNVKSVVISPGITSIADNAFYDCTSLISISIPDSVTSIGNWAFDRCTSLKSIELPDGLTNIADNAFCLCSSLTQIDLPDTLTDIGSSAFSQTGLTEIVLPNGLTAISDGLLSSCPALKSVTIPDSVVTIGIAAFEGSFDLKSVTIPAGVTSIGNFAFRYTYISDVCFKGQTMPYLGLSIFHITPTIYCLEGSEVEDWAKQTGYDVVHLDTNNLGSNLSIVLPEKMTLWPGETSPVNPYCFPAIAPAALNWSIKDTSIATVKDGIVTAKAPGTTTITASCGKVSAEMTLSVLCKAESFELSETEILIVSKETAQLSATNVAPTAAFFTWKSSDDTIVAVNENGMITGARPGTAIVTATSGDMGRSCTVHVTYPVTSIAFEAGNTMLFPGHSAVLNAVVTARTETFVNRLVAFTSSNEKVATIEPDGTVHAVGLGTAIITAKAASGVSSSCTVTVREFKAFTLPAGLTAIESESMMGTAAEYYVLPKGVKSIGIRAFACCSNLVYIEIPASVTDIESNAFEGCSGFTIIAPSGSTAHTFAVENGINWQNK